MSQRQYTPSPWHDAVAQDYYLIAKWAPGQLAQVMANKYCIADHQAKAIYQWCKLKRRHQPCPVAA